jgi:hypothetical protein
MNLGIPGFGRAQHEHIGAALCGREGSTMVKSFEDLQQVSKENVDLAMKSVGAVSKSAQAIATEIADYSKKSFEDSTATLEKLFGVKSVEKAIELQTEYAKSAYEGFVAEATKIGEMYSAMAKESYKPFETMMAKAK